VGTPSAGEVVLVPFPFSDLTQSKLRPAVVLANAGRGDFILCQVTSNSYADGKAVELARGDFASGSLHRASYARPGKLFTASATLIVSSVGMLHKPVHARVVESVIEVLRQG